LVIVYFGTGSVTNDNLVVAGYTDLGELYSSDVEDTNMGVAYKYMTATPDTSFVLTGGSLDASNAGSVAVQVFRDALISSEQASATGINGGRPNPPGVTPTTSGSVVVVGGSAGGTSSNFTSSDLTNFITDGRSATPASNGRRCWSEQGNCVVISPNNSHPMVGVEQVSRNTTNCYGP